MFLFQSIGRPIVKAVPTPAERSDVLKLENIQKMPKEGCLELNNVNTYGTAMSNRLPQYDKNAKEAIQVAARVREKELGCPVQIAPEPPPPPVEPTAVWYNPMSWTLKALYRAAQTGKN